MLGSSVLDVVIGVVFLYLLLSLICSAITEGIARIFAMRSTNLREGIQNLLGEQGEYVQELYKHPLISGLYRQGRFDQLIGRDGQPSYIPSRTFALALLDILGGTGKSTVDEVREEIVRTENEWLKKSLLPIIDGAKNPAAARANVEAWFNDAMERVSGWYKRKAQLVILGAALVLSVTLNADTIEVVTTLWNDTAIRESVVAAAQRASDQPLPDDIQVIKEQLTELPLPLGWQSAPGDAFAWITKIVGLLLTALALSLGAPFWFDLLNKLVRLRESGESPDTASGRKAETAAGI